MRWYCFFLPFMMQNACFLFYRWNNKEYNNKIGQFSRFIALVLNCLSFSIYCSQGAWSCLFYVLVRPSFQFVLYTYSLITHTHTHIFFSPFFLVLALVFGLLFCLIKESNSRGNVTQRTLFLMYFFQFHFVSVFVCFWFVFVLFFQFSYFIHIDQFLFNF